VALENSAFDSEVEYLLQPYAIAPLLEISPGTVWPPDFIDVGSDIWIMVYDWHVKHFQPLSLSRDAGGRYLLLFMQTTLVLRADAVPNYIGTPYDKT
jgi:hypothetical protein